MKKIALITSVIVFAAASLIVVLKKEGHKEENNNKPKLIEKGEEYKERNKDKNKSWSVEESKEYAKEFDNISKNIALARKANGGLADGALFGTWKSRGPFNVPGSFQFCEVDEGTNNVYTVSTGHYGGVQFIYKGTLKGDKWKLISAKYPFRFDDLIVLPNGDAKRVIAGRQNDKIMYTDNEGESWSNPTGFSNNVTIKSTIVNRQKNNIIYTTDGQKVYVSTDTASSFKELQDFGSKASNTRLYSPRWSSQPGASEVYLVRDSRVYKLNSSQTTFDQIGTAPTGGSIAMSGDSRKLWIVIKKNVWYSSTNGGVSFNAVNTTGMGYGGVETHMFGGQFIGVNPENPDILIGGYISPLMTKNAGRTTNTDAQGYWGYYQNSVNNDPKVRVNYHPDLQSSQFFYDKEGKLMSLRSSDGGVFLSYNDWTKDRFPSRADLNGVYYNISLFDVPTQETYRGGFIYGYLHPDHLSAGTQDQGWQDTRESSFGDDTLYWDQRAGGDGPCCITGDGKIGWSYNYPGSGPFRRFELYNGNTFTGQRGAKTAGATFSGGSYFTPSVGDWEDGNRIWVLSKELRRVEYVNGRVVGKQDALGGGNTYIQGVAQSRVNANIVYAMKDGNVHKSTNRGNTWSQIANKSATGISGFSSNRGMGWSSPKDSKIVLFATQSGTDVKSVFSDDGGVTWQNVTGSGVNKFPAALVNGMAGNKDGTYVFASTSMGPYVFAVSEKKWYPLASGSEVPLFWGQIVYCVDYGDKELVQFSTWGQGIWSFEMASSANDMSVVKVEVQKEISCTTSSVVPSVTIRNNGTNEQTSLTLKVYLDGVLKNTIPHTTSLNIGGSETVKLPTMAISSSQSTIKVAVSINGSADEVQSNNEDSITLSASEAISNNEISIIDYTTEETSGEGANNGRAIHLMDGDEGTFWHSKYTSGRAAMPYEFVFDMKETYSFSSLNWLSRQNNTNGDIATARIYVSDNQQNWGGAHPFSLARTTSSQIVQLPSLEGRYVKLEILSNHDGNNNIGSIAELNFNGCLKKELSTDTNDLVDKNDQLLVYPNPATSIVNIKGEDIDDVKVFDSFGKAVLGTLQMNNTNYSLDTSNYASGVYFIKISSKGRQIIKKVIVK